jgi:hypothetical protein
MSGDRGAADARLSPGHRPALPQRAQEGAEGIATQDDAERRWQHPWLRVSRLIWVTLGTRWSANTWPDAKAVLGWALAERGRLRRVGWFN